MPATRQYVPADNAPAAPCDQDCWWWQRCKDRRLACWQFESFVREGKQTLPPTAVKKHEATRDVYELIFKEKRGKISK